MAKGSSIEFDFYPLKHILFFFGKYLAAAFFSAVTHRHITETSLQIASQELPRRWGVGLEDIPRKQGMGITNGTLW